MTANSQKAKKHIQKVFNEKKLKDVKSRLHPDIETPIKKWRAKDTPEISEINKRWEVIPHTQGKNILFDENKEYDAYQANIENIIGTIQMPLGLAGPLRINGLFAKGDYYIPLATHEAALVASYHRGCHLISACGGATSLLVSEGVTRSPGFIFKNVVDAASFAKFLLSEKKALSQIVKKTTQHGSLEDIRLILEGNHVYALCDYLTGDAAGQNMVTIATQAICEYLVKKSKIKPENWFVEANASGDKKASSLSFMTVRGKKVTSEVIVPSKLIKRYLHTDASTMEQYWKMSAMGGVLSGTIGVQGHYANGLAALFLACGQDVACVSEASVGITRFEATKDGSLHAIVTLPNLIVGTVGGGTNLPSAKACLDILQLHGSGKSQAFAEVCATLALAGELSIIGSLSAGDFTKAHQTLARHRKKSE